MNFQTIQVYIITKVAITNLNFISNSFFGVIFQSITNFGRKGGNRVNSPQDYQLYERMGREI